MSDNEPLTHPNRRVQEKINEAVENGTSPKIIRMLIPTWVHQVSQSVDEQNQIDLETEVRRSMGLLPQEESKPIVSPFERFVRDRMENPPRSEPEVSTRPTESEVRKKMGLPPVGEQQ